VWLFSAPAARPMAAQYVSSTLRQQWADRHSCLVLFVCIRAIGCRKLVRLTGCYERVFRHQCGLTAGRLVAGLMKRAFADPHYQRYRYRPDCYLHRRRRRPTLSGRPRSSDQHCRGTGFAVVAAHHRAIVIALVVVSTLALVSPNSPYRISSLVWHCVVRPPPDLHNRVPTSFVREKFRPGFNIWDWEGDDIRRHMEVLRSVCIC